MVDNYKMIKYIQRSDNGFICKKSIFCYASAGKRIKIFYKIQKMIKLQSILHHSKYVPRWSFQHLQNSKDDKIAIDPTTLKVRTTLKFSTSGFGYCDVYQFAYIKYISRENHPTFSFAHSEMHLTLHMETKMLIFCKLGW